MQAALVLVFCGGCSWAFMDHLPDHHSPTSEPSCSTTAGWAALDIVFAIGAGIAFDQELGKSGANDLSAEALGAAVDLLIHVSSAGTGLQWSHQCQRAIDEWRSLGKPAPVDTAAEERRDEMIAEARKRQPPPTTEQRGFFCASSASAPAAAFCTKERSSCENAHAASVGFVPDLGACALIETAWCTGDKCAPTAEACEARRAQAGSDAPRCSEQQ
jgi:hypothetical protein